MQRRHLISSTNHAADVPSSTHNARFYSSTKNHLASSPSVGKDTPGHTKTQVINNHSYPWNIRVTRKVNDKTRMGLCATICSRRSHFFHSKDIFKFATKLCAAIINVYRWFIFLSWYHDLVCVYSENSDLLRTPDRLPIWLDGYSPGRNRNRGMLSGFQLWLGLIIQYIAGEGTLLWGETRSRIYQFMLQWNITHYSRDRDWYTISIYLYLYISIYIYMPCWHTD